MLSADDAAVDAGDEVVAERPATSPPGDSRLEQPSARVLAATTVVALRYVALIRRVSYG
jgi:hypothetical protein